MAPRKGGNIFQRILQLVLDKASIDKTKRETQQALKDATDPKGAEGNLGRLGKGFDKLKVIALGLATALVSGLALALRKVVQESSASQKVAAQQEAVLRSTGQAAGRTAAQLERQATALSRLTTFQDDTISSAQNLLLTFRKLREEEFDKAVEVTLDLATAMGTDASSAALQLGKALQDPITGITALRRSGVSFSQAQQDVIKNLVETNRLAEAQRLILAELDVQFGGSAEAARNTLGGALEGLNNAWDDLFEVTRESSSGIIRLINGIAAALPVLDGFIDKTLRAAAAVKDFLGGRESESFSTRLRTLTGVGPEGRGGMGDVRRAEAAEAQEQRRAEAVRERDRLAALEEERAAQKELAEAEEARRKAAESAHAALQRAQEERFRLLVDALRMGVATAEEEQQLLVVHRAIQFTLRAGNVELEERIRLTNLAREATEAMMAAAGMRVSERDPGQALQAGRPSIDTRAARGGLIADAGQPITAPDITAQFDPEEGANKTKDAWVDALREIGVEAQIASGFLEAAFGGEEGFIASLARIASRKVKENLARAVEVGAGGLAAFVFGDPTKLAPAGKAAAGFTLAAGFWGALAAGGGGGGGGGGIGGGFGGGPASSIAGRSVDRMQPITHTTVYVSVDPFDPKNGVHQKKVGDAVVYWEQRSGGKRK